MTTLADVQKAIAEMDAWGGLGVTVGSIQAGKAAADAAINYLRSPEFAELVEEVERLREDNVRLDAENREALARSGQKAAAALIEMHRAESAEANFAQAAQDMRRKDALIEAAEAKLAAMEADAEIGRIAMRFVDRLNDPTPEDSLAIIVPQFCAAIDSAIAARGEG